MGIPIGDALNEAPPDLICHRVAYAQADKLATVRLPGDKKRSEADRWFATTKHPVRSGNEAMYLVDGIEAFKAMGAAIQTATKAGEHFIYMVGWSMHVDTPMIGGLGLRQLFQQASDHGVQIRAMVWEAWGVVVDTIDTGPWGALSGEPPPMRVRIANQINVTAVDFINGLANGQAVLDNRNHGIQGAHHQKILVVNGEKGLIGFAGGVDVFPDRIFPYQVHDSPTMGSPMHDVHCRLQGPITRDLLQNFVDRWSDFATVEHVRENAPLLGRALTAKDPPPKGKLKVQFARTAGVVKPPFAFAPGGETTIHDMFIQAIGAARRFIYIEDQYLINMDASAALQKAIDNIEHLTILIPDSSISDLPRVWELRKKFIEPIAKLDARKVSIYVRSPFGPNVPHSYVHAKTWIFDDQFAIIGSANCNQRGWRTDTESCVGIYDESSDHPAAYTFAHRLRIRLWAEHLNMNTPEGHALLADGVGSRYYWSTENTNIRYYDTDGGTDKGASSELPLWGIDPQ